MEKVLNYRKEQTSPKLKREKRTERSNLFMFILLLVVLLGLIITSTAFIIKEPNQILVDYQTREIKGEYRTSLFRTTEEMINGGVRFIEYYLSLNSGTIERDTYIALMMLSSERRKLQRQVMKKTNHVSRVLSAEAKSHVDVHKDKTKVIYAKGNRMKVEYRGDVVIDASKAVDNRRIPFHLILDLEMVSITSKNTSGVEIVDYHEYGVNDAFK